jgi:hypothetical protein
MVEPIMMLAVGFLAAGLLVVMTIPAVHRRAVRLTTQKLLAAQPPSMVQIQAEKDQFRASLATSTQRLEWNLENLRTRTTDYRAEIGRKTVECTHLKAELDRKSALIPALHARHRTRKLDLKRIKAESSSKTLEINSLKAELDRKAAEIHQITAEHRAEFDRYTAEINLEHRAELDRKAAEANDFKTKLERKTAEFNDATSKVDRQATLILAHRARHQVRKSILRKTVKLLLFLFVRSGREPKPNKIVISSGRDMLPFTGVRPMSQPGEGAAQNLPALAAPLHPSGPGAVRMAGGPAIRWRTCKHRLSP